MLPEFWPYEEVHFELKDARSGTFTISCPWVESEIEIEAGSENFQTLAAFALGGVQALTSRPNGGLILSQILSALSSLPISYRLPRRGKAFGKDLHTIDVELDLDSPQALAKVLKLSNSQQFGREWSWDAGASLELANLGSDQFDPLTLLTVARRFHYLDCSDNEMAKVYEHIQAIQDKNARADACALIVRQNHYVTEKCENALTPARTKALSVTKDVEEFIQAERGHDKLLAGSLRAMGRSPSEIVATPAVIALMAMLENSARFNFLAFCMALDFFEKPQFRNEDELGEALSKVGQVDAAKALQIHKDINDGGEHEAISTRLLMSMKPVDRNYARQALRFAELVSGSIARVPHDLSKQITS